MRIVLVVAGNLDQFRDGCLSIAQSAGVCVCNRFKSCALVGDTEYRFVNNKDHMRGYHGVETQFWGTAYERKDIEELMQQARLARLP